MPTELLGLPAGDGAREPGELGDIGAVAAPVELAEPSAGFAL